MKNNSKTKFLQFIKDNKNIIIEVFFAIVLITSLLLVFKNFIIGKLYYLYRDAGSDTLDQYYPYYVNEVLGLKKGNFSVWNFNYGLGTSIFNTTTWTFDIFAILLVLAGIISGVDKVVYLLVWMQIFKIIVIYILSRKYMSYFLKDRLSICLASYLSAMNGYIFLWGQHFFLGTSCFYMLIMLCAIEYFLANKNKKSIIYLALSTALLLIYSYYVGYMILLISALYFIFRYFYITKKVQIKELCKNWGKCIYGVVTGILLSGTIFVPAAYHVVTTSSRLSSAGESIFLKICNAFTNSFNFEYVNMRISRLMSNNLNKYMFTQQGVYYGLPELFCTIFIFFFLIQWIIYDFKKANTKKDYIFFALKIIALYLFIFNGVPGLILNAFVEPEYRYTYAIIPFLALIVGIVWENVIRKNKINIFGLILSLIISLASFYCSVKQLPDTTQPMIYRILFLLIIGFIALFFINKRNKYSKIFMYSFLIIILLNTCYDHYVTTNNRRTISADFCTLTWDNEFNLTDDTGKAINFIKENDKSFYRIEQTYTNFSYLGDSFIEQNSSVVWYNSTINPDADAFYKNIYPNAYAASHYKTFSLKDESDLQALYLTNSKYILSKEIINKEGIEQINKIGEIYIYRNTATNSVAKWYNKTIREDEYIGLTEEEKTKKLYNYAIVNENLNIDEKSTAEVSEFNLISQTEISGNVSVNGNGLLMVAIPKEEGWNAYIDNNLVDTYKVDYGFIGIVVPEGEHEIELKYTTPKMKEGSILTIIGLISLTTMIFIKEKKNKIDE